MVMITATTIRDSTAADGGRGGISSGSTHGNSGNGVLAGDGGTIMASGALAVNAVTISGCSSGTDGNGGDYSGNFGFVWSGGNWGRYLHFNAHHIGQPCSRRWRERRFHRRRRVHGQWLLRRCDLVPGSGSLQSVCYCPVLCRGRDTGAFRISRGGWRRNMV
ncbi:MAG: hypothetical protein WCF90_05945 [Methanomicrobiales archaeon]